MVAKEERIATMAERMQVAGAQVNKCPQFHLDFSLSLSLFLFGVVLGENAGVCGKFVSVEAARCTSDARTCAGS